MVLAVGAPGLASAANRFRHPPEMLAVECALNAAQSLSKSLAAMECTIDSRHARLAMWERRLHF